MTSVGELKFEVATNNRTFIFRAESEGLSVLSCNQCVSYLLRDKHEMCICMHKYTFMVAVKHFTVYICAGPKYTKHMLIHAAERNDWVTVLQDCTRGRHHRSSSMNPGSPFTPDYQGYLELKGLRSKLYTVVALDKVFLYKNMDVRTLFYVITDINNMLRLQTVFRLLSLLYYYVEEVLTAIEVYSVITMHSLIHNRWINHRKIVYFSIYISHRTIVLVLVSHPLR